MNVAIILAGGVGNRFGSNIPKQFVEVFGKPVLCYTIEKFEKNSHIDSIEIVCLESFIPKMKELVCKYRFEKVKWITKGGSTFQESVFKGIENLKSKLNEEDIVLTHFGASPFVENDVIDDCINVCKEKGNAISTTPFYYLSTFRDSDKPNEMAGEWVSRESLACMNSPHAFKYGFILGLYEKAVRTGAMEKVEPHTTSLMQYMGEKIYFSKGSQSNIKITTPDDLLLFEAYCEHRIHKND